jgi:radical SAM superfamily enzyme YgiQ (UPF0313 family)
VLDLFREHQPESVIRQRLAAVAPDLVIVVAEEYDRKAPMAVSADLAQLARDVSPDATIALMGTAEPGYYANIMRENPVFDVGFVGEPDGVVPLWLSADESDYGGIRGLLWREGDEIRETGVAFMPDLDGLPAPDWDAVDAFSYQQAPHRRVGTTSYVMLASRSCPYRCSFCEELSYFKAVPVRLRSPRHVVDEMKAALRRNPMVEFSFQDAVFGMKSSWNKEFCGLLRAELPQAIWSVVTRSDALDGAALVMMREAGCYNVLIGVESANEETLRFINKTNVNTTVVREFVANAHRAGMSVTASFVIGLPGEGREDIRRTVDFAIDLEPDYAQFVVLKHFSGYRPYEDHGTYTTDWDFSDQDMLGPLFISSLFADKADLRREQWRAYRRFYFHPRYLARKLPELLQPSNLSRSFQAVRILGRMGLGALSRSRARFQHGSQTANATAVRK